MRYFKNGYGEVRVYSEAEIDQVGNLKPESLKVFHTIAEKLKNMTELTGAELEAHLNPPPSADVIRSQRNALLQELDAFVSNPLRFAELIEEEIAELAGYRQLLLDVTEQPGFPTDITMPTKPAVFNQGATQV